MTVGEWSGGGAYQCPVSRVQLTVGSCYCEFCRDFHPLPAPDAPVYFRPDLPTDHDPAICPVCIVIRENEVARP